MIRFPHPRSRTGRVVFTSMGSFGDIHPFIAVAAALQARGVGVLIAASEAYRGKVTAEGLPFRAIAPAPAELQTATGLDEAGILRCLTTRFIIDNAITPYLDRTYDELRDAMDGASLVVACNFSIVARIAAGALGLPVVTLLLSPCAFFSAAAPSSSFQVPWLVRFHAAFGTRATKLLLDLRRQKSRWQTRHITRFRRRRGLAAPACDELLDGPLRTAWVYALYSPVLGEVPADAPATSSVVGYTFYDRLQGPVSGLPEALDSFLQAGPAPLIFTLGSTGIHAPRDFYRSAAAAARRLGMRAVLLVGSEGLARDADLAGQDVFVASYAPHSLIFPRGAALVHHGGIGTVGQALRAGRVQLVCPMLGDQPDNAERLIRLGVAARLDHRHVTVDGLVTALSSLLGDASAVAKAAALGAVVAEEDGAAVVADDLMALLRQGAPPSGPLPVPVPREKADLP